jgi:spermidine synthase
VDIYAFLVIGMVSCSMLMYEILLTRISALRLFFHFGFLVISNCLLGIGAAGALITLFQKRWSARPRTYIWRACILYLISLGFAYGLLLTFDLPADLRLDELGHFLRFSAFNLAAALPFFAAGAVVGMVLSFHAQQVNRLYAVDLAGAGLGCLIFPLTLSSFGAGGTVLVVALLALAAVMASTPAPSRRAVLVLGAFIGALALWWIPRFDALFPVPTKAFAGLSPQTKLILKGTVEYSKWSAGSRIDLHSVPESHRFMFGRGIKARGIPLGDQKFISQDGSAGTAIFNFSDDPDGLRAVKLSLYSAALALKERPRVFIIGVGGGNDVWAAKAADARYVKGIELNQPIIDIHREVLPHFSRDLLRDPTIHIEHGEGRSKLRVDRERYDVIQMTGIDTWTGLASGAYILAENYLYTREAIEDMYDHLAEGGIIQIARFSAAMEALRLLANAQAALDTLGAGDLRDSVICFKAGILFSMLLKKGPFTAEEVDKAIRFADDAGISIVYMPQPRAEGQHDRVQRNLPAQFIASQDKEGFIRAFPRDISPTTDDRPYFFNYTKWGSLTEARKYAGEPTSVSQGNPIFLFGQLALSTLLAVTLIVLPLAASRRAHLDRRHAARFLIYFLGLGAGFIAIEVALIQKLTLFLGHPLYSITVTLFCILIFTGVGSLLSRRWFEEDRKLERLVPAGLALSLGLFILVFPKIVTACIGLPLLLRALITALSLAPTAFLLGVPFAYGIRLLVKMNPSLIPWAWAVNGGFSVVGSVLTVVVSMNLGFTAVLIGALGAYAVAFAALPRGAGAGRVPCRD